ncbi:hypothetical protein PMAYCL1PPCAC_06458 [Pristionchus mayeri]|uniref:Uncharacterized protein n=1 Tax=Pristionchus mayeri TaxID=1317129 RepID=A0AAN4Z874_9BILA|nr:hypothetical protein PMAYCL1PPCAC_06458 [Pristionchus mayeri]
MLHTLLDSVKLVDRHLDLSCFDCIVQFSCQNDVLASNEKNAMAYFAVVLLDIRTFYDISFTPHPGPSWRIDRYCEDSQLTSDHP